MNELHIDQEDAPVTMASTFQRDIAVTEVGRLNSDQVNYLVWRCVLVLHFGVGENCADDFADIYRKEARGRTRISDVVVIYIY